MCSRLNVVETHPRRRGSLSQGSVPSFFALVRCETSSMLDCIMSRGAGGLSYEHYERTSIVWDMDQLPLGGARCSTEGAISRKVSPSSSPF
jgi:hypothetical protein